MRRSESTKPTDICKNPVVQPPRPVAAFASPDGQCADPTLFEAASTTTSLVRRDERPGDAHERFASHVRTAVAMVMVATA
jgi:hypothetical protein